MEWVGGFPENYNSVARDDFVLCSCFVLGKILCHQTLVCGKELHCYLTSPCPSIAFMYEYCVIMSISCVTACNLKCILHFQMICFDKATA